MSGEELWEKHLNQNDLLFKECFVVCLLSSFLFYFKALALPNLVNFALKKIYLCCLNEEQRKKAAAHEVSIWKHFLEMETMQCKKGLFSGMVGHLSYYFYLFL